MEIEGISKQKVKESDLKIIEKEKEKLKKIKTKNWKFGEESKTMADNLGDKLKQRVLRKTKSIVDARAILDQLGHELKEEYEVQEFKA